MSKEIFKNITNFINDYPLLLKKEILNKLLELVGDKEDKYYEEFFDIYIKDFKLKNICVINFHISNKNKVIYFNNFKNIYEFIEIIKDYYNSDLLKEIKNLLDNIFITPPSSPKPIKPILPPSPEPILPSSPKHILPPSPKHILPHYPEPILPPSPKPILPPSPEPILPPSPEPILPPYLEPILPSSPEPILPPSPKSTLPKPKKISIPIALKIQVWDKWIGLEIGKHKCLCCKTIDIIQMSFHCGHVIPECKGGKTNLSNLKPICQTCNLSMGTKNMDEFMKKFQ